jgi:lysophospholipase L1-like esterase
METSHLFVCLGDSLTAGSPGFSGYGGWMGNPASQYSYYLDLLAKQEFPAVLAEFLNYGVGGDVVKQMFDRFHRDVLTQLEDEGSLDYVLVMGGNNDVVWHDASPRQALEELEALFNAITVAGAKVIGLEILPVTCAPEIIEKIRETNDGIHQLGESIGFPVVSLFDQLADENQCLASPYDSGDGEHLSVHGYEIVGTIIYNAVIRDILAKMAE